MLPQCEALNRDFRRDLLSCVLRLACNVLVVNVNIDKPGIAGVRKHPVDPQLAFINVGANDDTIEFEPLRISKVFPMLAFADTPMKDLSA